MALCRSTAPCPPFFQQWKKWFPKGMPPVQVTPVKGVTTPSSSAPVATATLKVEPGGNTPCTARLLSGCFLSSTSVRHSALRMPRANTLGSKDRTDSTEEPTPHLHSPLN